MTEQAVQSHPQQATDTAITPIFLPASPAVLAQALTHFMDTILSDQSVIRAMPEDTVFSLREKSGSKYSQAKAFVQTLDDKLAMPVESRNAVANVMRRNNGGHLLARMSCLHFE